MLSLPESSVALELDGGGGVEGINRDRGPGRTISRVRPPKLKNDFGGGGGRLRIDRLGLEGTIGRADDVEAIADVDEVDVEVEACACCCGARG